MRALMFSDWCVVKKYLAHYLLTSLVIGGFTAMGCFKIVFRSVRA